MYSFLENEKEIRNAIKPFADKYNFQVSITKDAPNGWYETLQFFNDRCKVVLYNDLRYEEIAIERFINPKSQINNEYRLINMVRLRKVHLITDEGESENLSNNTPLEDIEFELQFIDLHFKDVLEGNFKNLDDEGYWELSERTIADVNFFLKHGRYPD